MVQRWSIMERFLLSCFCLTRCMLWIKEALTEERHISAWPWKVSMGWHFLTAVWKASWKRKYLNHPVRVSVLFSWHSKLPLYLSFCPLICCFQNSLKKASCSYCCYLPLSQTTAWCYMSSSKLMLRKSTIRWKSDLKLHLRTVVC